MSYEKVKWVQQRMEVEAFYVALQTLSRDLKAFTEYFSDLEYPNDAEATEDLLRAKEAEMERLMGELQEAAEHGESLLKRVKETTDCKTSESAAVSERLNSEEDSGFANEPTTSVSVSNENGQGNCDDHSTGAYNHYGNNGHTEWINGSRKNNASSVQLINVISVEKYIIQIEETTRLFQQFWAKEKAGLDRCLRLRKFEHNFRELQVSIF